MQPEQSFARVLDLELKRAERYRIFISMIVFDLSLVREITNGGAESAIDGTVELIRKNIREIDNVVAMSGCRVGLLFPETPRQGAEIVSKRLTELIRTYISGLAKSDLGELIPLEMVSYPDAAGAKSMSSYLEELLASKRN
jgi:hypothetical protein